MVEKNNKIQTVDTDGRENTSPGIVKKLQTLISQLIDKKEIDEGE